ncbi:MAG: LysR family transcriptional regulator [Alphaproteobacteria bacterium]|nr:LysR family transcriptional regulator [Alphaproteobacteria bacterium]
MDLKQLRSFLHVSELNSFSKAAERLHLSQPALSRQIKLLEAEIGEPLFVRTGRGVEITSAGELLERRASAVLSELERFNSDLAAQKGKISGELCIGLPPSSGRTMAGPLIERYRTEYPDVKLRVIQLMSGTLQEQLLDGRVDLGILYEESVSPRIGYEPLSTEELVLLSCPGQGEALGEKVTFDKACGLPLVLPGRPHGLRTVIDRAAVKRDLSPNIVIEVDSLSVILELVRRGLAYSILANVACQEDVEAGRLTARKIECPSLKRTTVLAWPKDFPLTPAAKVMAKLIHQQSIEPEI